MACPSGGKILDAEGPFLVAVTKIHVLQIHRESLEQPTRSVVRKAHDIIVALVALGTILLL
jgi:diphthamide biosynthesis methyltransferase